MPYLTLVRGCREAQLNPPIQMPELPEVEHVVRALQRTVVGRRVVAAELKQRSIGGGVSAAAFNRKLQNARIEQVCRRGKYILFEFDTQRILLTHLRMTGKFVYLNAEQSLPPYAHVIIYLDDDRRLVFCDMRKFGRLKVIAASRLEQSRELGPLAPEPFSDDFSEPYLDAVLSRSQRPLKSLLLDQTKVAGLGNIYASEVLFLAKVSPFAPARSLSRKRVQRLHQAIRQVLLEAIEGGSTLQIDLEDGDGNYLGNSERFWRVYERESEPCVVCGTRIRRVVQGGRSTYYCPRCQR